MMQTLTKITKLMVGMSTNLQRYSFATDTWRERDEAAEKVYITEAESNYTYI
jgi:hypothetical protein